MREAGQARQIPLHSVTINKRWRSLVSSCISGWLSPHCFFRWLQVSLVLFAICKAEKSMCDFDAFGIINNFIECAFNNL